MVSPAVLQAIVEAGKLAAKVGADYLGKKNQRDIANANYQAIYDYLGSLDERRNQARNYMQGNYEQGEKQFMAEANTPLPELEQQSQDIQQATAEQQQEANKQMQAQLANQGVRGGQANTLLNRGTGQLARESLRDINQLKFREAIGRQGARLGYTGQKALIPYGTLNQASWLYMPSENEQSIMANAINKKFNTSANNSFNWNL